MLKYLSLNFAIILCSASIIRVPSDTSEPQHLQRFDDDVPSDLEQIVEKWEPHVRDFLNLIDDDKLMPIIFKYMNDPDVINLMAFIGSSQFKDIVLEVENIEEFKEAVHFLESKGYDVEPIIELFNSILKLQKTSVELQTSNSNSNSKTVTSFIREITEALPIKEMKKMLIEKLVLNPEIAELFDTVTSEEFTDILKRFSENPKVFEIVKIFENYGLNYKDLSSIFDDIFDNDVSINITNNLL